MTGSNIATATLGLRTPEIAGSSWSRRFYCISRLRRRVGRAQPLPADLRIRAKSLVAALAVGMLLGACQEQSAREAFRQHLAVCDVAEGNGLLDQAVESCTAAMQALDALPQEREASANLQMRLASLERQRQRWAEAAAWIDRAERAGYGDRAKLAVERALVLAGQGDWLAGASLLEASASACESLTGEARREASNVYRGFARHLALRGENAMAGRLRAISEDLAP